MFLKNKNIIFKIRRSKVTDYAALTFWQIAVFYILITVSKIFQIRSGAFARGWNGFQEFLLKVVIGLVF